MRSAPCCSLVFLLLSACGARAPSPAPLHEAHRDPGSTSVPPSPPSSAVPLDAAAPPPSAPPSSPLVDGVIFEDEAGLEAMALDARGIFVGTSAGVLMRARSDGALLARTHRASFPWDRIVSAGPHLYWNAGGAIVRVKKGDVAVEQFVLPGGDVDDLLFDGKDLYGSTVVRSTGEARVFRASVVTGALESLWTGPGSVRVHAFDAERIYFSVSGYVSKAAAAAMLTSTSPPRPPRWFALKKSDRSVSPWSLRIPEKTGASISELAFAEGRAFAAIHSPASRAAEARRALAEMGLKVHAAPNAGAEPRVQRGRSDYMLYSADASGAGAALLVADMCTLGHPLVGGSRDARRLRADGGWIYWVCRGRGADALHRVSSRGGEVETLVSVTAATRTSLADTPLPDSLQDYAVDGHQLYWAERGERNTVHLKTLP